MAGGAGGVLAHGRPTAATTTTSVADVVTGEGGLAALSGADQETSASRWRGTGTTFADGAGHGVRGGAVDVGRVAGPLVLMAETR